MILRRYRGLTLTLLTMCEVICFFHPIYLTHAATILYVCAGISICLVYMMPDDRSVPLPGSERGYKYISYFIYMALLLLICNWISNLFHTHIYTTPLGTQADMLLFIREMSQRFLAHLPVYDLISDIYGSPVHAVYLPAFWLPYTVPVYLGVDMRWTSFIALIVTVLIIGLVRYRRFHSSYILLLFPLALFVYRLLSGAAFYLMHTQEAVVLLYMALLAWSLIYEKWTIAGIAAACCILSRYFIGVPLLAGIVWLYTTDRKAALKATLSTLVTLVLLLTISRSWGDIGYFLKIPFLYINLLSDSSSLEANSVLYYMSVGFASFFRADTLHILSSINLIVLVVAPVCYFLFAHRYLRGRRKGLVLLCGIKFFLVLFLTTLSYPYGYVLFTASVVSMMVLRDVLSGSNDAVTGP